MRLFSTRTHGILDYASFVALVVAPGIVHPRKQIRQYLRIAPWAVLAYAATTRYELGVVRVLPMRAHLAIDALFGVASIATAAASDDEEPAARALVAGMGLFSLFAALATEREPG